MVKIQMKYIGYIELQISCYKLTNTPLPLASSLCIDSTLAGQSFVHRCYSYAGIARYI